VAISYLRYLGMLAYPKDMGIYYPLDYTPPALWKVVLALAALVLISVATVRLIRKQTWLFTGWFWFVGTMVPVVGIVHVGEMSHADRYVYFPAIGLFIAVVWSGASLLKATTAQRIGVAVAMVAVLFASLNTRTQVRFWEDGEAIFRQTLKVTSVNPLALNTLGSILVEKGRVEEAEFFYLEASTNPKRRNVRAMRNLALLYKNQGKCEQALSVLLQAYEFEPDELMNYLALGNVYVERNDMEQAIVAWEYVTQVAPENVAAPIKLAQLVSPISPEYAMLYLEDALVHRPEVAELHREMGVLHGLAGNSREAITSYLRALELNPYCIEANYYLGRLYADMDNLETARQYFEKELEGNPRHAETHHALAKVYLNQNNYVKAVPLLAKAVDLQPSLVASHLELAFYFFDIRKPDPARKALGNVLRHDPENLEGNMLATQIALLEGRTSEALRRIEPFAERAMGEANVLTLYGRALLANERPEDAEAAFDRALAIDPRATEAIVGKATVTIDDASEAGLEQALTRLTEARRRNGEPRFQIANALSRLHEKRGDRDRALAEARKALPLAERSPRTDIVAELKARIQRLENDGDEPDAN